MGTWCYRATRDLGHVLCWPFVRLHIWRAPGAVAPTGAAVIVANHIAHFDPLFVTIAFQRTIDWMTTEEFYDNPLAAAWLRAVNTFPVDRSRPDRRALRLGVAGFRVNHGATGALRLRHDPAGGRLVVRAWLADARREVIGECLITAESAEVAESGRRIRKVGRVVSVQNQICRDRE